MKKIPYLILLAGLPLMISSIHAQEIRWWTFTGGGGSGQAGAVHMIGALGQLGTGAVNASAKHITLSSGFWSGTAYSALPDPGLPSLSIELDDKDDVLFSWPISFDGFLLEYTIDFSSGRWIEVREPTVDTPTLHTVTVPKESAPRFFRLRKSN